MRIALATAADGLPITLDALMREFGAEGREGWEAGDYAHPAFLRAFAAAVSERLARERTAEPEPEPPTQYPHNTQNRPEPEPLEGLELLREDWRFIDARTLYRRDRAALLTEYAERWREAAARELVPHHRANAGRRAANTWLREITR